MTDRATAPAAGFTIKELIVVVAVLLVAGTAAFFALRRPDGGGRPARCATNLKQIGTQLQIYNKDQDGTFPTVRNRERGVRDADELNAAPTAANACETFDEAGRAKLGSCPMQEVWPLMVTGGVNVGVFHCPADKDWQPRSSASPYGWTSGREFSYGLQWPYAGLSDGGKIVKRNRAVPYGKEAADRLAVMADRNPGGSVGQGRVRHSNHPETGCNVLERGGAVVIYDNRNDSRAGVGDDDIYVNDSGARGRANDTVPESPLDTVIVPVNMPRK